MTRGNRQGRTANPLYKVWASMRERCTNANHPDFDKYGGRGITVCERWANVADGFENFLADMGPRPEGKTPGGRAAYSLDRVDVDGDYEPSNCRWADDVVQRRNRRGFVPKAERRRETTCVICAAAIVNIGQRRATSCSPECRSEVSRRNSAKRVKVDGVCARCGTHFTGKYASAKYCSVQCNWDASNAAAKSRRDQSSIYDVLDAAWNSTGHGSDGEGQ